MEKISFFVFTDLVKKGKYSVNIRNMFCISSKNRTHFYKIAQKQMENIIHVKKFQIELCPA